MKNKKDDSQQRNYAIIAVYAFIVIVASVVAFLIINAAFSFVAQGKYTAIFGILGPLILAFVIAYLLSPLVLFFEKRVFFKLKNTAKSIFAVLSAYIVVLIVITLLAFMVIPQVASSIRSLTTMVADLFSPYEPGDSQVISSSEKTEPLNGNAEEMSIFEETELLAEDILSRFGSEEFDQSGFADTKIGAALNKFAEDLQNYIDELGVEINIKKEINDFVLGAAANIINITMSYTTAIFNTTTAIVSGIASAVLNIVLGILLSVYLLLSKDKLIAQIKKLLFALCPNNIAYKLVKVARKTHEIFGGFVTGKIIESLILGVICYICMIIFQFRYAMLISVIVAVMNVVPFFGSIIGGVIGALFLAIVDIRQAMWFILFIIVLQQFDGNILGPKILGSKLGLSSFWIIVAVIVMSGLLGLPGIFIGVPIFAVIYVLIKEFAENRLERKGFPVETRYYSRNLSGGFEENVEVIESEENKSIFSVTGKIARNISAKFENKKADKSEDND